MSEPIQVVQTSPEGAAVDFEVRRGSSVIGEFMLMRQPDGSWHHVQVRAMASEDRDLVERLAAERAAKVTSGEFPLAPAPIQLGR